eukprot:TRINITY_DN56781_c0_g1_i1.p1 TRINITY_DN56781_c0_g1~~TRINITY_DN56781_c0_g1_i1.p1  ORF type:complete len:495 (-),score=90.80 TRINITY_DN56781_c0_g1_i1:207-1691(-)
MLDSAISIAAVALALSYIAPVASRFTEPGLGDELRAHFQLAVPSVLRYLFFTLSDSIFVALIGQFDATPVEHFDGATLGMSLTNITGLSIGFGFLGALAPFVAQECGSSRENRCGLHLWNYYKSIAVIFACSWCISNWADVIMLTFGQDPKVSACVQKYASIGVWAVPFQLIAKGIQQVLDAQADVVPGLMMDVTASLVQVPCAYMVLSAGYGYRGAATIRVVVNALAALGLSAFVLVTGRSKKVWHIDKWEKAAPMLPFLQLAFSSTFATCIEWWAQECMIIISGWLPHAPEKVAAQSVLFQLAGIFYMVWIGAKNAVSMRVGNLIGAGQASKVPQCLLVAVTASVAEVFVVMALGSVLRDNLVACFTKNAEVFEYVGDTWETMFACFVPYSITFVLYGVLAGAGRQGIVAGIFVVACVVGLSLGVRLCFVEQMELEGLWLGNDTFFVVASVVLYVIILRTDWSALESLDTHYQAFQRKVSPCFDPHLQNIAD